MTEVSILVTLLAFGAISSVALAAETCVAPPVELQIYLYELPVFRETGLRAIDKQALMSYIDV